MEHQKQPKYPSTELARQLIKPCNEFLFTSFKWQWGRIFNDMKKHPWSTVRWNKPASDKYSMAAFLFKKKERLYMHR